jgi:hypothetical protein
MKAIVSRLIRFLFLTLFAISCRGPNQKDENQIITYDLKELPEISKIKLSDLGFVDIEYLPLETNEQSVIPMINDIIFGKDYFLTHFFSKINMFRYDGSFIAKIGTEGRGPNEFTVVHDIDINRKNQNIYLVDGWQKRFYIYSESGQSIGTFKIPFYGSIGFRFTDDGILCYNMNQSANVENSYTLIDTSGRILKYFPNMYPWYKAQGTATYVFQSENIFYRLNNQLFKKEVYSDTVYVFENKDFKPHLVIETGKRLITAKTRSEYSSEQIRDNFITPINLFEFGDYIYYEFIVSLNGRGEGFSFIGSKKNNFQSLVDPEKGIINDLDGGPSIWPKTIKDDNTIISWVDALKLKAHISSDAFKNSTPKFPKKKKELEKLANNLKETDNPVLMLVKFKK